MQVGEMHERQAGDDERHQGYELQDRGELGDSGALLRPANVDRDERRVVGEQHRGARRRSGEPRHEHPQGVHEEHGHGGVRDGPVGEPQQVPGDGPAKPPNDARAYP